MQFFKEVFEEIKNLFVPKKKVKKRRQTPAKKIKKTVLSKVSKTRPRKKITKKSQPIKKKSTPKPEKRKVPAKLSVPPKNVAKKIVSKDVIKSPYVGQVTHYFSKISVVVIKIEKSNLMVGDKINIKGQVTDLIQVVKSLQIESVDVKSAKVGQLVGLKVLKSAQVGDKVYKLS